VIANERQYRITRAALRRFEEAIAAQQRSQASEDVHPRIPAAVGAAMESEAEELRRQIQRYEDLRDGRVGCLELEGLRGLPAALIEGRIAAGLTHKELAERLGLKQQQIQRWEATSYSGVGLGRLQDVVDALGMGLRETVSFAVST
jgi:adenylosuccinate lyase